MEKKLNFIIIIFTSIFAILITIQLYGFLYDKCFWNNLNDLYTGLTIFSDHNKYLDLSVIFIYTGLFFIILPLLLLFGGKLKFYELSENIKNKLSSIKPFEFSFEKTLCKYQYIGLTGYILLYPFDGKIYPALIIIISALIITGIIDIKRRKILAGGGNNSFSPWAIAPLLFVIFHNPYNIPVLPFDEHHSGEKFAAYFMHDKFNMQYYKDIMLVHGFRDMLPSICGKYLFGSISVYSSMIGEIFLKNISTLFTSIVCMYIFSDCMVFALPLIFITGDFYTKIYYCTYLIFLKNIHQKTSLKITLWIVIFIIISYLFMINWTTIGSFWIISALPLAGVMIFKLLKQPNKLLNIFIIIGVLLILLIPCKDFIIEYLKQAQYYVAGNLYSFGNNFGTYNYSIAKTCYYLPKLLMYIMLPVFISELINSFKNKKINDILFYLFIVIFTIISVNYAFGRLDYEYLTRISYISLPFLGIMIPYYLYIRFSNYRQNIIKPIILIIFTVSILNMYNNYIKHPNFYKYNNELTKSNLNQNTINEIKSSNSFLDLTNHGMYYMYFNKKIPINYTSYYNIITTKQAENCLRKLINAQPDIIMLYDTIKFDGVFPSLRINPIYRWILLSGKYELKKEKTGINIYLKKINKEINYTKNDLNIFDNILSTDPLFLLPEVWANSINTLPIYEIKKEYKVIYAPNQITLEFKTPQKGRDIDLLYIEPLNKTGYKKLKNYSVEINDLNFISHIQSHRNGKMLIPIDNYVSWLLSENIKTITIYFDEEIKTPYKIRFYKRKFSDDMKKYL